MRNEKSFIESTQRISIIKLFYGRNLFVSVFARVSHLQPSITLARGTTKALAYYTGELITAIKSFLIQSPRVYLIKITLDIILINDINALSCSTLSVWKY